jgi:hypothetical protein
MITKPELNARTHAGAVGKVEYAPETTIIIPTSAESVSQNQASEIPQPSASTESKASPNRGAHNPIAPLDQAYLNNN